MSGGKGWPNLRPGDRVRMTLEGTVIPGQTEREALLRLSDGTVVNFLEAATVEVLGRTGGQS